MPATQTRCWFAAAPAGQQWRPPAGDAGVAATVPAAAHKASFAAATPMVRPAVGAAMAGDWTVLGSFRQRVNAERVSARLAELQPRIVPAHTAQGLRFRVVSAASVTDARASGVSDAWPMAREMPVATVL